MEDRNHEGAEDRFATLEFKGLRFDHANLPLDFLENIAAYQRLLREFAVEIWREKNQDRARLPKGFKQSISLSFQDVKEGSALANIKRDRFAEDRLPLNDIDIDYLALAQDRFLRYAQAANDNLDLRPLPASVKADLKVLASGIDSEDRLNIVSMAGRARGATRVSYSQRTAERLQSAVRKPETKTISGLAIVGGIDDPLERIKLISTYGVLSFPVTRDRIRSEFKDSLNQPIQFTAHVRISAAGTISEVVEANSIARMPTNDEYSRLMERLAFLELLEPGWRDGEGCCLSKQAIHWARDLGGFIASIYSDISAFPTIEGGVNYEFSVDRLEVILSISGDSIVLDVFDDSDSDMKSFAFFAVTPKLLTHLANLMGSFE